MSACPHKEQGFRRFHSFSISYFFLFVFCIVSSVIFEECREIGGLVELVVDTGDRKNSSFRPIFNLMDRFVVSLILEFHFCLLLCI
jgi:hypothetical protein